MKNQYYPHSQDQWRRPIHLVFQVLQVCSTDNSTNLSYLNVIDATKHAHSCFLFKDKAYLSGQEKKQHKIVEIQLSEDSTSTQTGLLPVYGGLCHLLCHPQQKLILLCLELFLYCLQIWNKKGTLHLDKGEGLH